MRMSHTPGPFRVANRAEVWADVARCAECVASCRAGGLPPSQQEADARRVAAALNATEAVGTEALEAGAVAGLVRAVRAALERLDREDQNGAVGLLRKALVLLTEEPPPGPPPAAAGSARHGRRSARSFISEDKN
jgi:hypothetical protein